MLDSAPMKVLWLLKGDLSYGGTVTGICTLTTILSSIIFSFSDIVFLKIQSVFILHHLSLGKNTKGLLLLKPSDLLKLKKKN